jgi:hypothetical protein
LLGSLSRREGRTQSASTRGRCKTSHKTINTASRSQLATETRPHPGAPAGIKWSYSFVIQRFHRPSSLHTWKPVTHPPKTREEAKQQDGLGSKFEFLQHARHGAPAVSGRPHLLVEYVFTRNTLLLHKPPQLHGQIGEFGRHGTSFGAFCCWYGDDLTHSSPSHLVSFEMNRTTTTPPTFDMSRRTSGTR